jgi:serine/threonine protein phosphatase PrpC
VLDGHGGPEVAKYAAKYIPKEMMNEPYYKLRNYSRALINVFRRIDDLLASCRGEQDLKEYNKETQGSKLGPEDKVGHKVGTTAVVLLMTKDRFYVANIGDSRAVLCRGGKAVPLSTDHKPDLPSEHNRIQKAGGFVSDNRINGSLNLSRAFGDFDYKKNEKGTF